MILKQATVFCKIWCCWKYHNSAYNKRIWNTKYNKKYLK